MPECNSRNARTPEVLRAYAGAGEDGQGHQQDDEEFEALEQQAQHAVVPDIVMLAAAAGQATPTGSTTTATA